MYNLPGSFFRREPRLFACGVMWQWGIEGGGPNSGSSLANAWDSNDAADMRGSHLYTPRVSFFGAAWGGTAFCGAGASHWGSSPLWFYELYSGRGVSERPVSSVPG